MAKNQTETSAPEIKAFNNNVSKAILISIIILIVVGGVLAITGYYIGIIIGMIGVLMWWAGDKEHSVDPREAGMLTVWDQPVVKINEGGKEVPIVVGGRTIVMPYFPFFIDTVVFDTTSVDKRFEMTVLSGGFDEKGNKIDPVPLKGWISITLQADVNDALDYIQSGKMENIFEQLDDIVYEQTKALARIHDQRTIAEKSEVISAPLREHLENNVFERKSFGVRVIKIQARFDYPEKIVNTLIDTGAEKYQRTGELAEYNTDMEAARLLQELYIKDTRPGEKIPSLPECLKEIKNLRLIRDERVARIETDGNVSGVIIRDVNMDMGRDKNKKKGDK